MVTKYSFYLVFFIDSLMVVFGKYKVSTKEYVKLFSDSFANISNLSDMNLVVTFISPFFSP